MKEVPDEILDLFIAGALEPDEVWAFQQRASAEDTVEGAGALSGWAPLTWSSLGLQVDLPLAMDMRRRRFEVRFELRPWEAAHTVVVMQRTGDSWRTHLPTDERRDLAGDLQRDDDGRSVLHLNAAEGGEWAIALAPPDLPIDFSQPDSERWKPLWRAIAKGDVRGGAVSLRDSGRV